MPAPPHVISLPSKDLAVIATEIRRKARDFGFDAVGISDTGIEAENALTEARLDAWLASGFHGSMHWMARHGNRRARPSHLRPGTLRAISVRMNYLPDGASPEEVLADPRLGYIARYALGRDYHWIIRRRLERLAQGIQALAGPFDYRVYCDSGPVMEKPIAARAGLGWMGKHTNLIDRDVGSWFFLGEIYTDLPLPPDPPNVLANVSEHCGTCRACIDVCPTGAILAPWTLDARRCISYLTIEHPGPIPEALRPLLGNRIYGCDDCQLVCPWNRFAQRTREPGFEPRDGLDAPTLVDLFAWDEATFLERMKGSAIRRIGHERWLRNIAVALGNAAASGNTAEIRAALEARRTHPSALVREHVNWALRQ